MADDKDDELHVGPYQGPVACQVLRGRGVCLHCARTGQPVVVPDVEQFPGHIACDCRSKSDIALPVLKGEQVIAVLDRGRSRPSIRATNIRTAGSSSFKSSRTLRTQCSVLGLTLPIVSAAAMRTPG